LRVEFSYKVRKQGRKLCKTLYKGIYMTAKWIVLASLFASSLAMAHGVPGIINTRTGTRGEEILTNVDGMTLYTFDPDKNGSSTCYNGCVKAWPAVLVTAQQASQLTGEFSVTQRQDGTLQVRFDEKPLYLYVGDSAPGDATGDGLGGVWHTAVDEE
jgi:predicted lipoprotein with Yx(FWY)xxD motif